MFLVVLASGGSPAARVSDTGPLTASALVTIAIFAVLVIVGILYGIRQKRIRAAGEEEERQRAAELPAQDDGPPPPVEPTATPPATEAKAPAKPAPVREALESDPTDVDPYPGDGRGPVAGGSMLDPGLRRGTAASREADQTLVPQPESAPAAEPEPAPKPSPPPVASKPVAPAAAPATDRALIDVKGLGPKAVPLLAAAGVSDLATLAALTPERAAAVDAQLGALSGRLTRDRWVEQARLLAAGDIAAFESTFGKL